MKKKVFSRSMSWILSVVMIFGFFIVPASIQVLATQSRKENFSKNYTTVSGNPGQTVANIAYAQIGKSGSALGYTEDWCADFVSDCAELAGQSAAVPRHGRADYIDEYILNAGGYKVSAANAKPGDIAFYDFNGNNSPEHVEIVYSVSGSTVKTVGGNTGNNNLYYATVCSPRSPGSLLYIIRPNYINVEHTHNYTEYVYYWAAHPHYKCYQCSCGDVKENRNEIVVLDTCADCLAEYKATLQLNKSSYLLGDSVTVSWNKINNATHYNLWIYKVKSDGTSELVSRNDEIKDTKFKYSNLSAGKYYTYFQTYNSNYWTHDNSDWFHSQADRVYFEIKLPTYTISYNMNGGSGSISNQTKTYGQDLTLSSTKPTRTGYAFVGWNTNKDATSAQYAAGGKYTANSGATLYAIWSINKYTISYNMNGGSGSISNQTKTYGQDLTLSSTKPTRTGYAFVGWNTSASATTAQYQPGGKYTANSGATLYAIWKINTWTVSYNMNGGSGSISNQTKTYGQDLTLSSTKPTRTGYTFVGWNTSASATTAQYQPGGKYTANSGATLYAIWKINTWTVSYNMNGGSGSISNQTKTYGQDLTLSSTKPTRTGYDFVGWNTNKDATTAQYQPGGKYTANSGATLYAIWKEYSVLDDISSGKKVDIGNHVYILIRRNSDLLQICDGAGRVEGNENGANIWYLTKTNDGGYYIQNYGTGRYIDVEGSKDENDVKVITTPYTGNNSQIWYIYGRANGEYFLMPKSSAESKRVMDVNQDYPKAILWNVGYKNANQRFNIIVLPTWTVKYDINGGNGIINDQIKISNCDIKISDIIPTKSGYTFLGWSTNKDATTAQYQPGGKYTDNSGATLYAIWKINTWTVSYNMNGGSGSIDDQIKTYGVDLTLSSKIPTRDGYTFVGWNSHANATTAEFQPNWKYVNNYGIVLYAIWKINAPTDKPVISNLKDTYSEGSNLTFTWNKVDRATSYGVAIWRNPGGESTKIVDTSVTTTSYTLNNMIPAKYGIYIYAKNESGSISSDLYNFYVPFTIKYDLNGGTGTISPTYKKLDIACNLSITEPTRPGYTFVGWNTDKNATTALYQPGAKYTVNGNVILYAIWKENPLTNTAILAAEDVKLGSYITINASATGGVGDHTYAVWYKLSSASSWTTKQNYSTNATIKIKPASAEKYDISVKVKDSNGTIVKKSFTVNVFAPLKNTTTVSSTSIGYGGTFTVKAKATGGLGDYTYAVYYKKASATKWTTAQNYSSTKTVTIKPKYAEEYDVSVKVKDSRGVVAKKTFKIKVTKPTNTSKVASTTITLGNTIDITCSATGGSGFYQYAVYYKKSSDTSWKTKQSYSSNYNVSIKPASKTKYDVSVKVKDSLGNVTKKAFTITVK